MKSFSLFVKSGGEAGDIEAGMAGTKLLEEMAQSPSVQKTGPDKEKSAGAGHLTD